MDLDTGPRLDPLRTPNQRLLMDIDSEHPFQSSPDSFNQIDGNGNKNNALNPAHKRANSSLNQLSQSCHNRNSTLFHFKLPVNVDNTARR
jgi:hypothetical protein